jgi:hypothetical protein
VRRARKLKEISETTGDAPDRADRMLLMAQRNGVLARKMRARARRHVRARRGKMLESIHYMRGSAGAKS